MTESLPIWPDLLLAVLLALVAFFAPIGFATIALWGTLLFSITYSYGKDPHRHENLSRCKRLMSFGLISVGIAVTSFAAFILLHTT